jgi:hypothetical protein
MFVVENVREFGGRRRVLAIEAVHDYLSVTTDGLRFHNRFAQCQSRDD